MELNVSLDKVYTSFEAEEFQNDLKKLDQMINKMNRWLQDNLNSTEEPVRKIEEYLTLKSNLISLHEDMTHYTYFVMQSDLREREAQKYWGRLQAKNSDLEEPEVRFQKWLDSLENLDEIISSSPLLEEHRFYLCDLVDKVQYRLSEKEEKLLARLSNTGSQAWNQLQGQLTSGLKVEWVSDGEERTITMGELSNILFDNPQLISKTYEAEYKAYDQISVPVAAALNGVKGEVLTELDLRGYESPLEKALVDFRMEEATLTVLLDTIKKSLGFFRKFYKRKAEILGFENGLPIDLRFKPVAESSLEYTPKEARDLIVRSFKQFSDPLADFAERSFSEEWFDAEMREGKMRGGFCMNFHSLKESRILHNFHGGLQDVAGLAHELGHAYHFSCLANHEPVLNREYTPPISETASTFAQTMIDKTALEEVSKKEKLAALDSSLAMYSAIILNSYRDYLFEAEVFERRKDHSLPVEELRELELSLQKDIFKDSVDSRYLSGHDWINRILHYYAEVNFYNFPYAFGLLLAKGIYAQWKIEGKSFVDKFEKMLAVTGKASVEKALAMLGIDLSDKEFWQRSLAMLKEDVEEFIRLSEELNY